MSRKTLFNILFVALLVVLLAFIVFEIKENNSNSDENLKRSEENKKPALTKKVNNKENQKRSQAENKQLKKQGDDNTKKQSPKTESEQTAELNKNTTYLLKKMIEGKSNSNEDDYIKSMATDKMINQIDATEPNDGSKIVDLRNTSIKFQNTNKFKNKEIKGTFKYDLLIKPKDKNNSDIKASANLNQTRAAKFIKEDGKYKLDQLSK